MSIIVDIILYIMYNITLIFTDMHKRNKPFVVTEFFINCNNKYSVKKRKIIKK